LRQSLQTTICMHSHPDRRRCVIYCAEDGGKGRHISLCHHGPAAVRAYIGRRTQRGACSDGRRPRPQKRVRRAKRPQSRACRACNPLRVRRSIHRRESVPLRSPSQFRFPRSQVYQTRFSGRSLHFCDHQVRSVPEMGTRLPDRHLPTRCALNTHQLRPPSPGVSARKD